MKTEPKNWIVYDGNCGMCLFSKKVFSRLGFFKESDCRNYHELNEALCQKVDLGQFKHGMAYVAEGNTPTRYGLEGVLAAFSQKRPYLKKWKPNTLIFKGLNFLYNAICYNRYFIFPMERKFACSCEPDFNARYFRRWIGLGIFFSVLISTLFGLSLASVFEMEAGAMALRTVAIVGAGWMVQLLIARLAMSKDSYRDYLRHIAFIMFVGVMVLLPTIVFCWLPAPFLSVLALINVMVSSGLMLRMHFQRIRFMEMGQGWTLSWFASLQLTAIPLMFHFQLLSL